MTYTVEMTPGGLLYAPSFMTIDSGIQVLLRLLLKKFEAAVLVLLLGGIYEVRH
jgi:hypothetical protein